MTEREKKLQSIRAVAQNLRGVASSEETTDEYAIWLRRQAAVLESSVRFLASQRETRE